MMEWDGLGWVRNSFRGAGVGVVGARIRVACTGRVGAAEEWAAFSETGFSEVVLWRFVGFGAPSAWWGGGGCVRPGQIGWV